MKTDNELCCVNICTGSLALALPIPILAHNAACSSSASPVLLINRNGHNDKARAECFETILNNKAYKLRYKVKMITNRDDHTQALKVNPYKFDDISKIEVILSDEQEDLSQSESFMDKSKNKNLIITLAPKGVNAIHYTKCKLKQILKNAHPDKFIFVISCENGKRLSTLTYGNDMEIKEITKEFKHLYFLDCIVDRMASEKWIHSGKDFTAIDTEKYFKWIIEMPLWKGDDEKLGTSILESGLRSSDSDCKAELIPNGDYDKEYCKKTICVNGLHYSISLLQEYIVMLGKNKQEFLYEALHKKNPLFPFLTKVIKETKTATVNKLLSLISDKNGDDDRAKQSIENEVNIVIDDFIDRMRLSDLTAKEVLKPLTKIVIKYQDQIEIIQKSPSDFLALEIGKKKWSRRNNLLHDFMTFFINTSLPKFSHFLNLYEFESKLLQRIIEPISFVNQENSDIILDKVIKKRKIYHLERVALIANSVVQRYCSDLKREIENSMA